MKKIRIYALTICAAGLFAGSCTSNFDEYNTNQNQMEMGDVHPLNLLEHILFTGADGMVYRTWLLNNELMQYTVQMYTENVHRYMIRDSYNSGTWNHLARWAANADHMIEQAVKNEDPNSEAIALTMRALFVSNWTDIYGDIPFSEAFQGRNNVLKPKFDTQREIYTQLFADLERANTLYEPSRALRYPNKDLLFAGDLTKWRKFTNSLHMRLLMRLQNRDAEMGVSEKLREIVSNPAAYPVMASNADNAALFYTNVDPFIGHFGTMTLQSFTSNSHRMAEHLVNMMNNTNDPRLGIYAVQQNNEWSGLVSGFPSTETNATNCAYLNKEVLGDYTSPYTFMRYDEVLFILSEAAFRGMIPGGNQAARTYYDQAVLASIDFWDEINPSPTYEITQAQKNAFMEIVAFDNTLEQILNQKYIALFWEGYEAWHEYRRTGYPVLTIGKGTDNNGVLPTRFIYPVTTVDTNRDNYLQAIANQGPDNMRTTLWWARRQ